MGQAFELNNIDPKTLDEVSQLQRAAGERWTGREIAVYRITHLIERQKVERAAKIKQETQPVKMTSRADTGWARRLNGIADSQTIRNKERINQADRESREFEKEKQKWDRQAQEVLRGGRWD